MDPILSEGFRLKLQLHNNTPRTSLSRPGTTPTTSSKKDLFYLPLEIRRLIYSHLFQPTSVDVTVRRKLQVSFPNGAAEIPEWDARGPAWQAFLEWKRKLLRVSPAVHDEALEFLYRPLRFHFGVGEDLRDFLHQIGPRARSLVAGAEIPYVGPWEEGEGKQIDAVNEGIALLRESRQLSWVKITVHDHDLATVGEEHYCHPAAQMRGLKQVEVFRRVYLGRVGRLGRGPLVDGEACARFWEAMRADMMRPAAS